MVNCSDFLQDYSSYRDGLLSSEREDELRSHVAECESCARYDRVIGGGVELVRSLDAVEPSDDFMDRLQHRIYHVEDEMRVSRSSSGSSLALTVAIAAAIGVTAWTPSLRPVAQEVMLPPIVASAPVRTEVIPSIFRAGPILTGPESTTFMAGPQEQSIFFRYSPIGIYVGESQAQLASQPVPPQ
jgi:anti-sigma factor RsiW